MLRSNNKISAKNFHLKVILVLFIFSFSKSWGQAILQWNTFENTGTETSEPSTFNDPNLSATNLTFGTGITVSANANRFGGTGWSTAASASSASNSYIEFIVTPTAGCSVTPTSFAFTWLSSATGPTSVALRSSADAYAADIGTQAVTGTITSYTINIAGITNNSGPLTFRLYGIASSSTTGTGGFDQGGTSPGVVNVQLNGSTSCNSCISPSITSQPTSITTTTAGTVTYTIATTGTTLIYQWQVNSGSGFSNISNGGVYSGATTPSLTLTNPTISMNTYSYQCVVTNTCGTATSSTATLSIITCSTPTISPSTQTVCINNVAVITASVSEAVSSYQWQMSSNNSTWSNVANGTPSGVSYSGATSGSLSVTSTSAVALYYYRCLIVGTAGCTFTTSASSINIVSTGITTNPYDVYITTTQTATFAAVASGSPTSYQWQVNSGSGYSNVSNGGVYSGATNSLLTVSNPPTSMNSYSYQCIVSYFCGSFTSTIAVLHVNATTSATCPQMTGAFINACNGACNEGDNEILFFNSGSTTIPVNPANINITYGSVSSPTATFTDAFTTNAAYTASLNAMSSASCTTLFVDASSAGTIPANSVFMILRNTACFTFDFSSFCPANTVYVLYSSDATWLAGGNFTNGGSVGELRFFTANFTGAAAGCVTNYNYQPNYLVGGDGASISFINGGGAANAYFNNGCTPPALVLPIELLDFYATQNGEKNDLVWKVASENNILQYIIEKSEDGINFSELTRVNANNIEGLSQFYSCEDNSPYSGLTYYKLSTIENNHQIYGHKVIAIDRADKDWKSILYQNDEELILEFKNAIPKNAQLLLFDLSGKLLSETLIEQSSTRVNTTKIAAGIYFAKIETPYKTENFKIIISK